MVVPVSFADPGVSRIHSSRRTPPSAASASLGTSHPPLSSWPPGTRRGSPAKR